jgi:hypothetical protein
MGSLKMAAEASASTRMTAELAATLSFELG